MVECKGNFMLHKTLVNQYKVCYNYIRSYTTAPCKAQTGGNMDTQKKAQGLLDRSFKDLLPALHRIIGDRRYTFLKHPRYGMFRDWEISGPDFITIAGLMTIVPLYICFALVLIPIIGILCLFMGLTDIMDGIYARAYPQSRSVRGFFLDSFFDKCKHLLALAPFIGNVRFEHDLYLWGFSATWLLVLVLYFINFAVGTGTRIATIRKIGWEAAREATGAGIFGKIKVWFEAITIGVIGISYANQYQISPLAMIASNVIVAIGALMLMGPIEQIEFKGKIYRTRWILPTYRIIILVLLLGTLPDQILNRLPQGWWIEVLSGLGLNMAQFVGIGGFAIFTLLSAVPKVRDVIRRSRSVSVPTPMPPS